MQSVSTIIGNGDQRVPAFEPDWPLPIVVRQATSDDLGTIVEFNLRLAQESANKTISAHILRAGVQAILVNDARGRYFVACDGNEVVGQIMVFCEWNDWRNGWMWWLDNVYVKSDARRRGVFRTMFSHVQQLAIETSGVVGMRLHVSKQNLTAQRIYERFGMRQERLLMELGIDS